MINLRNALLGGKRLPYDAEVEYLQADGNSRLNAPVALNSTNLAAGVTIKMTLDVPTAGNNRGLLAQGTGTYSTPWCVSTTTKAGEIRIFSSGKFSRLISGLSGPTDVTVEVNSTTVYLDIGGTRRGGTYSTSYQYSDNLAILGYDGYNESSSATYPAPSGTRLYAYKMYVGNNLVADCIPVRKGTVGYLYDRVSGKLFGNAGTGDFVLRQDVVPVEWLEFTGTQRLLTDITPSIYSRDLKTSITYQLTSTASRQLSGSGSSYFEFCSNGALVQVDASYPADLNRHTLDFIGWVENINLRVYYDGQSISAAGFIRSDNTSNRFTLGSLKSDSQSNPLKAKVSSLSMEYQDATKFLHWLPVRVGTDATSWEGAMMDVLTRRIYRNAGTGAFAYGNDLKYPIPAE